MFSVESKRCRIGPENKHLFLWNLLNVLLVFYNCLASPYRVAFHSTESSMLLIAWEWFNELIFVVDILISFLTPIYNIDGTLQFNQNKIT